MSVGNRHDAEDLTTQTFLKMLESIGRFRWQSAPFSAWLFRIAHNLSMDHFRSRRRWQPEEDVPEIPGSEEPSAELEAMQSIGRQSMLELIEKLSPEQQQVLTLKFVSNFPNADVAKILDKTVGDARLGGAPHRLWEARQPAAGLRVAPGARRLRGDARGRRRPRDAEAGAARRRRRPRRAPARADREAGEGG